MNPRLSAIGLFSGGHPEADFIQPLIKPIESVSYYNIIMHSMNIQNPFIYIQYHYLSQCTT